MKQLTAQQNQSPKVVDFNELDEAGAYVTAEGSLVRVPIEALKDGHSPLITISSKLDTRLSKISDDPFVPVGKARQLAADADMSVNF